MRAVSEKVVTPISNDDQDRILDALTQNADDQAYQKLLVSEGLGMLTAYLSIADAEVRQSIKQLVERLAFKFR